MLGNSALLSWFCTFVLLALAGRATARLAVGRGRKLAAGARMAEAAHAAMGLGMAILLVPGLPRPPTAASLAFFAALTAFAVFTWGRGLTARLRGQTFNCGCAPKDRTHLLDPHHAVVGAAMFVMLLRPGTGVATDMGAMANMDMAPTGAPGVAVLVLLGYVWIAALVLGYGMTKLLPVPVVAGGPGIPATTGTGAVGTDSLHALLGSPATVYGCELAMTVLTGLMLLS